MPTPITMTCPACQGGVPEGSDRCPRCFTDMTRGHTGPPPVAPTVEPLQQLSESDVQHIREEEAVRHQARAEIEAAERAKRLPMALLELALAVAFIWWVLSGGFLKWWMTLFK
jgi:hypothetical protein